MRHRRDGRKFGRNPAQRKAMLRQLVVSMILHERIMTTEAKAKELGPLVEKLVTISRENTQHHRNLIMQRVNHERALFKLIDVIGPRYQGVNGGYTRISKLGPRRGDAAPMALIEFVEEA